MVRKIFSFLYKETNSLHKAAYLLGFFALLSQLLAFLRDRLLAHIFGASLELDIYYAAFRIPDFIFVAAASVVSISVLVPIIVERGMKSQESAREFIDSIFSFFSILIIVLCAIAYFTMPYLSEALFKGFSSEAIQRIIFISRVMLLSPVALGFSNLLGSLMQAYNRFAVYAIAPLLYNAGIIVGIILFARNFGALGVALGVVAGASMHALVQIPFIIKLGLIPRFSFRRDFSLIKKVVSLSFPRTLTLSLSSVIVIFLISFASIMAEGSISVISLSINLQSVPLTIIGVSYSLAAFPTLSRYFIANNLEAFAKQVIATARHIIFWTLPATALFIVLRAHIVRVLLGTGEFDWSDTRLVAAALALFVVSAVFQSLLLLFIRAFYSAGIVYRPLLYSFISLAITVLTAYALVKAFYIYEEFDRFFAILLKVEDLPSTVVLALPLAFSIGVIANGILHWSGFEREFGPRLPVEYRFTRNIIRPAFQSFVTAVIMGVTAYYSLIIFEPTFETASLVGIFLQGFVAGLVAIVVGVIVLHFLGSRELREVSSTIRDQFWKEKVLTTDPEIV